jgi:phosphoribosylanthranilate isomerase
VTLVKICGLTRAQDVDAALAAGAWAIGFVITESPRQVPPSLVGKLAARVPPGVLSVGVFTIEKPFEIAKVVQRTGVRAIQLSAGTYGPNVAAVRAALSTAGVPRVALIVARDTRGAEKADFVLLDSRVIRRESPVFGGTGHPLDWRGLAASRSRLPQPERLLLAGGLNPTNARMAIRAVKPLAIDVSSGIEKSPGVKDLDKMYRLFAAVRSADADSDDG